MQSTQTPWQATPEKQLQLMTTHPETPKETRQEAALRRAVRMGQLLDLYGPLLTDKQREFMHLHYSEDLSFGEIAREYKVSRQAVHDAVKHAEAALENYDARLQLTPAQVAERRAAAAASHPDGREGDGAHKAPATPAASPAAADLRPAVEQIDAMAERLRRSGGVLYNVDGLVRELEQLAQTLRSAFPGDTDKP